MKPTLIFDYDGTIHNTMVIYESAFRQCFSWLVEEGYTPGQQIPASQIAGWLGLNSREMWNSFLPQLPEKIKQEASRRVGEAMVEQIRAHHALWYPGAAEVLEQLKEEGYSMVVLSNCKISYHTAHWEEFSMGQWFADFYDCETYNFAPKTQIIQEIKKRFPSPYVVIGDRRGDMDCARAIQSPFVGCVYGFGTGEELKGADALAETVEELPEKILEVCCRL